MGFATVAPPPPVQMIAVDPSSNTEKKPSGSGGGATWLTGWSLVLLHVSWSAQCVARTSRHISTGEASGPFGGKGIHPVSSCFSPGRARRKSELKPDGFRELALAARESTGLVIRKGLPVTSRPAGTFPAGTVGHSESHFSCAPAGVF